LLPAPAVCPSTSHLQVITKTKIKCSIAIAIAIWAALSLLFDVLVFMLGEQIKNALYVPVLYQYTHIPDFTENPINYNVVNTSSPSVYRLVGVCDADPMLLSSVVLMSTTFKSLMSPSDLVLPTTNNEKVVHRLAGVCKTHPVLPSSVVIISTTTESLMSLGDLVIVLSTTNNEKVEHKENKYKPMLKMMKDAAAIFLQPQIDLIARVRLCKLKCIQNQYLHQDFSVLLSKLQLYTYKLIWSLAYMGAIDNHKSLQYIPMPLGLELRKEGGVYSKHTWSKSDLETYTSSKLSDLHYKFVGYTEKNTSCSSSHIQIHIPLCKLVNHLSIPSLENICRLHRIYYPFKEHKGAILQAKLAAHICKTCPEYIAIFSPVDSLSSTQRSQRHRAQLSEQDTAK
jgi:hypothetical protein